MVLALLTLMLDPVMPVPVRARCAFYILEQTRRRVESENLEERIAELERVDNESRRHN
jgi:hypothetical protein